MTSGCHSLAKMCRWNLLELTPLSDLLWPTTTTDTAKENSKFLMFTESTSLKWTMYDLDFLASIQLHNSLCGPGDTTSMKGSSPLLTHTTLRPLVWWLEYLSLALFFSIIKAQRPSQRLNKNTTLISRENLRKFDSHQKFVKMRRLFIFWVFLSSIWPKNCNF